MSVNLSGLLLTGLDSDYFLIGDSYLNMHTFCRSYEHIIKKKAKYLIWYCDLGRKTQTLLEYVLQIFLCWQVHYGGRISYSVWFLILYMCSHHQAIVSGGEGLPEHWRPPWKSSFFCETGKNFYKLISFLSATHAPFYSPFWDSWFRILIMVTGILQSSINTAALQPCQQDGIVTLGIGFY